MRPPIPTRVVPSVHPSPRSPGQVRREFEARLSAGAKLRSSGSTRRNPRRLLSLGYTPKHKVTLFDTTFYLSNPRQNEDIRFLVGYLVQDGPSAPGREIFARLFYKDISLIWRSASHYVRSERENWIGKGDIRTYVEDGEEFDASDESTTNLPLEVQGAFETVNRSIRRVPYDVRAVGLVLRRGPDGRIEAYRDFREPRRRASADPRNRVNGGRSVARFTRRNDPSSLRIVRGFEPDFARGVLDVSASTSKLYGGKLERFRILSRNRRIQYLFFAGPRHVWIIPPQATTTALSTYGVRTVDVLADDDLFLPGYEYHFGGDEHDDPSQIPEGFVGEVSPYDPTRADTSRWLDALPVVREFRRKVLARRRRR